MIPDRQDDDAFDAAARRILRGLPVEKLADTRPPRRRFFERVVAGMGLAALGTTAGAVASYAATPRIVRLSASHGREEERLRGMLVPEMAPVLRALSLPVEKPFPGIVQLCKDCMVDAYPAWHIDAFMDNLGFVQVFVFRAPIPDASGEGWWLGQHWRFLPDTTRFPTLLLSQRRPAMDALVARLRPSPHFS